MKLGYALSSEEHGPTDLVEHAARAEEVGFEFASISDHFHPWTERQGNAPFVWSVLGGIAEATDELPLGTGVTCPIMRIHPVNVAQAAATAAVMFDGRFAFGVGTGEALNEHVVGERWPPLPVRLEMLEEAIEVIRELWTGEETSHHGEHYTVENARLFTVPEEPPPIHVSAMGERAATAAADVGDGLWTVGPQADVAETFEEAGGEGPRYSQLTVSYAEDEDEAIDRAYEWWPNGALEGELTQVLPTPAHIEQAAGMVTREDIAEGSILTSPDPEDHVRNVREFVDAGYDHVYVHNIGDEQEAFFEFYEDEVLPAFD